MTARTFDLDDRDQYLAYLEHTTTLSLLYGGLYLSFDGTRVIVHDPRDVTIKVSE